MDPSPRPLTLALALAVLGAIIAGLAGASPALARSRPQRTVDARLDGSWLMHGRVLSAVRVPGEHRGLAVTRTWIFSGSGCGRQSCRRLALLRERGGGQSDGLVLRRTGRGRYTGTGRFFVALECRGALYPHGELAPYTVTLTITRAVTIQGVRVATALSATYTNRRRTDRTICPVGPSHDSARYTAVASAPPGPPAAAFRQSVSGSTDTGAFQDTSAPGGDRAPIVQRSWTFGDPGSGAANGSTASAPGHTFSGPGSYQVTLTVTDADGLSAAQTQTVVAPGPPAAAFTDAELGAPTTFSFSDRSTAGVGGAPITAWAWDFGDPATGPANTSSAQNPQHTFSGPGSYNVCLTVTDANGRQASTCSAVSVS